MAEACAESIWGPSRIPIKSWLSDAMRLLGEKANTIFRGRDVRKVVNPFLFVMGYITAGSGGESSACQGRGDVAPMDAIGCLKGLVEGFAPSSGAGGGTGWTPEASLLWHW